MEIEHVNGAAAVFLQAERPSLLHAQVSTAITDPRVLEAIREAAENPAAKRVVIEVEQAPVTAGVLRFTVAPIRHGDVALRPGHHRGHHAAESGRGRHEQLPGQGRPRAAHAADEHPAVRGRGPGTVRAGCRGRRASASTSSTRRRSGWIARSREILSVSQIEAGSLRAQARRRPPGRAAPAAQGGSRGPGEGKADRL